MIGLSWWLSSKESACNTGDSGSISALGRSPGEGNDNHPNILPGKSHGQRSLGNCPWGQGRVRYNLATKQQQQCFGGIPLALDKQLHFSPSINTLLVELYHSLSQMKNFEVRYITKILTQLAKML